MTGYDIMTDLTDRTQLKYQPEFGNQFATENLPGALPVGRNSTGRFSPSQAELLIG